jgi:DNA-binding IclR family transcriptional regulator
MDKKSVKKNQSVEKVFQIIEIMAGNSGPMRLQDMSRALDMPASTALRFLNTLMEYGYVIQSAETLRYSLSMKFCHIGNRVSSQISIREVVRPYLTKLTEICQESACLAIEENMTVVYIDVAEGPDSVLRAMQRIGKRAPMHSTGVGKLLLLNYDEEGIDKLIAVKGLDLLTCNTIVSSEGLLKELNTIRQKGYAVDDEECEIGARCVAAPIVDYTGRIAAAISVTGPISRMTYEKINEISDIIAGVAQKISISLGYENK